MESIAIPEGVETVEGHPHYINVRHPVITYCKSNSAAHLYAQEEQLRFVLDDTAPTINNLSQEGSKIIVEATDNEGGCGLPSRPYSRDGRNWQSTNEISVTEDGTYTVYVKDKLGNIASSTINVTTSTPPDSEENKEQSNKGTEVNGNNDKSKTANDDTKSNKIIPQTGARCSIPIIVILAIIVYRNYKKSRKYN